MRLIHFPFERVIEINVYILSHEPGMHESADINKLQGSLRRIDNAIAYSGLDDVFEIAAKYTSSIAVAHSFPDANKRTGLADAVRDLVLGELDEQDFADLLYSQYIANNYN